MMQDDGIYVLVSFIFLSSRAHRRPLCWTMIIPIRCFTCGKVVANKYETYLQRLYDGEKAK